MTQRALDVGITEIKQHLMRMAGFVEVAIDHAIQAWRARNIDKVKQVYQIERTVNESHVAIDKDCFQILARQHGTH